MELNSSDFLAFEVPIFALNPLGYYFLLTVIPRWHLSEMLREGNSNIIDSVEKKKEQWQELSGLGVQSDLFKMN